MANRENGEVEIVALDRVWKMRFGANAICDLEGELGRTVQEAAAEMEDPDSVRIATIRAVLWASLRENHPDILLTHSGQILDSIGLVEAGKKIQEAFSLAFPEAKAGNR